MEQFLKGKHILVTGGTRGIGRAIAAALSGAGAAVAICGRSADSLSQAVSELSKQTDGPLLGTIADVRDERQVADLFAFVDENLGGLDVLVNNAGVGLFRPIGDVSVEEWRKVIDTNLTGAFLCCREALARFRNQNGGFIVNISSLAGKNPFAGGAAYNASKFGLNGFTEAMMMDHRHDNVRVSYIMPGSVDTEFSHRPSAGAASWKIAAEDVAQIVVDILRMPERTLISRVEVRPSKPPR